MSSPGKSPPKFHVPTAEEGSGSPHSPDVNRLRRNRSGTSGSLTGVNRIIVLAVDASENAKAAFDWFMENIYRHDDLVILTHCPEPPRLPTFSFKTGIAPPVHEWKTILDEMNTRMRKLEEDYESTCIEKKMKYRLRGEASKHAGEGIVRIAEDEDADLIVLGTRGMGSVKRALLGSVSDYVVRNAACPLLTVPIKRMRARAESGRSGGIRSRNSSFT